jgi:acyl-CoA synthetase (AMP-forming)/AMP-acid ligase II
MILGDASAAHVVTGDRVTLDALFRAAVDRRPDAIALIDPPNRESFTDGAPRQLTYAEADRVVWAIAGRLRRLGLQPDAVIGVQLPNTVEAALTLLGALRAGLIVALLPLLWRRAEAVAALSRVGAKALVTAGRVGAVDHRALAMPVAAEVFPIRYVCCFGANLADGVIPLDDLFTAADHEPPPPLTREVNPAAHVAVVSFEVTPGGLVAFARNHMELIAGGLAVLLEGEIKPDATILSCCPPSSFAGLAVSVLPWLIAGGTLSLHQPFDPEVLAAQLHDQHCDTVVLPGPLASRLDEARLLAHEALRSVLALWRAPERLVSNAPWRHASAGLVDLLTFGEAGLFGARRGADRRTAPVPSSMVSAPQGAAAAAPVAELTLTEAGTLALRGPMVPRHAFPPGAERNGAPHFKIAPNGFVDTGYACRIDGESRTLAVTGPPAGLVTVGGYRFVQGELQAAVEQAAPGAVVAVLPDALLGERFAGSVNDRVAAQAALAALGVSPLISGAFRDRRAAPAA